MIVCECLGITEGQLRRAVRAGATSPAKLARSCGAGTGCGGCRVRVRRILADEKRGEAAEPVAPLGLEASPAS